MKLFAAFELFQNLYFIFSNSELNAVLKKVYSAVTLLLFKCLLASTNDTY